MAFYSRKFLIYSFKFLDILIFLFSFLITSFIINQINFSEFSLQEFLSIRFKLGNILFFLLMILAWHLLFKAFELYHSRRLSQRAQEFKDLLKATTIATTLFMASGFVFNIRLFSPAFLTLFWGISSFWALISRVLVRLILKKAHLYGKDLRNVLIVGTNQRAYDFVSKISNKKDLGYSILGYIDKVIHSSIPHPHIKMIGTLDDFSEIISKKVVDEVIIALPIKSNYQEIQELVDKAEEQGILVRYLTNIFNTKISSSKAEIVEGHTVLTMASGPDHSWPFVLKRWIDLVFGLTLFILCLPIMIIIYIVIKFTSKGPALFVQERIGYNKRVFKLYKFRTMVMDAEKLQKELEDQNEMDGPVFKIQHDPRITKIGGLLRKTSLDELPQLINVILGDMSLVGPRPLPIRDYQGFHENWQRRRFSIKPGITCSWQIKGRNEISFSDWMRLDMEYIDNWSLFNDLRILFLTIPAVLKRKGAS